MAAALALCGATAPACAQDAIQWRVEDGGNGHWYRRSTQTSSWSQARDFCVSLGAHLATITTAGEQNVVAGVNGGMSCWLGGFQAPSSSEPAGGWYWITGEPWQYTNWLQTEPNNVGGNENALQFHSSTSGWNDLPESAAVRCVCEWSADCDSDGIVDYGQILDGTREDLDVDGVPDCCSEGVSCNCSADLDGDGVVNSVDLAIVLEAWGATDAKRLAHGDADGSGAVDGGDLTAILFAWGACP